MASIRFWILLFLNLLIILTVLVVSVFFYWEFEKALDDRVLLQLTSIKRLKRVQIEEFINKEWQSFLDSSEDIPSNFQGFRFEPKSTLALNSIDTLCLKNKKWYSELETGIYDLSSCTTDGKIKIIFIKKLEGDNFQSKVVETKRIREILLERTGMGQSGESYIVGEDYRLRTESRFFPTKPPFQIVANTLGVQRGLSGHNGKEILFDYRGVPVYSAYHKLELPYLNWIILSEMDVAEVTVPLRKMQMKLAIISGLVILFSSFISMILANVFSNPLAKMRRILGKMTIGDFHLQAIETSPVKEIDDIFLALRNLQSSINEAIYFSSQIGQMNLKSKYNLASENDTLGKSLVLMQERLIEYEKTEKENRLQSKKLLIKGQENERKRLSQELHDGLGPLLTSLKLTVQSTALPIGEKTKISNIVDNTISDIRRMTYDLMPLALLDFGVRKALVNFVDLIKKSSGLDIRFEDSSRSIKTKLNVDLDICLFRVCQELINNALKHAHAKKVVISLTEFMDKVCLYYYDDGVGFNVEESEVGSGLRNIKDRIEVFDGYLSILSGKKGTEIEVEIPLGNG